MTSARLSLGWSFVVLATALPWLLAGCGEAQGTPQPQYGEGAPDASQAESAGGGASDVSAPPDAGTPSDQEAADTGDLPDRGATGPIEVFAAPSGSGSACTLPAPCSLSGAQAFLRALGPSAGGDRVVSLRGGTYRLAAPFRLEGADSGVDGHPVVYQAYATERPILSGATQVTGFQLFDAANDVWRASVPPGTQGRQLFVNGVRADRPHTMRGSIAFTPTTRGLATVNADTTLRGWATRGGIEVALDNAWKHMRCAVAGIEATTSGTPLAAAYPAASTSGTTLVVDPACWANNETAVIHPGYPFNGGGVPPSLDNVSTIENVFELLGQGGQTGQFYLDGAAGYLYYVPRVGEDMATADVELPILESLVTLSGKPGHLQPTNDDDAAATYSADWQPSRTRGFGDWLDDVHSTSGTGAVRIAFHGTGIDVLGEVNADLAAFAATVTDATSGKSVATGSATEAGAGRIAQQVIYSIGGLPAGDYVVAIQKTANDGTLLVVDGFVVVSDAVAPVHDIVFRGITFAYSSWLAPSMGGYLDNQAGVLWDAVTHLPTRIPGAVGVHRGQRIRFESDSFVHLGGAALDLADGTRDSSATGNRFDDLSGGALSVGEVDDYYLADALASGAERMTSGITVADNAVTHTGVDYHDTVAIWVGNSRTTTVAHNLVAHAAYTGISVGWGWGWTAACNFQMAARPGEPCRRGTNYNGGNQIVGNRVYDVMRTLVDGGPIYTLGTQATLGTVKPTVTGNVVSDATSCFHMIYHDEGSSYWQTNRNVVYNTGCQWLGIWEPTAHDINAGGGGANYTDNPQAASDYGTSDTIATPMLLGVGAWPQAATNVLGSAGLEAAYASLTPTTTILNDSDAALRYSSDAANPQWEALAFRGFGDFGDDVHYATANGAVASLAFSGTGVEVLAEKDASQGLVEVLVDGASQGTVDTSVPSGSPRQVQQVIFGAHSLAAGAHTISLVKRSGQYATIDAFRFDQPVSETTALP
jgi:hypothetical protein